jgi:hypothetical protein
VQLAGGLAIDFPTISVAESFSAPTSMFLRNLMSMDTEEMIRAQPLDACIMIGGKLYVFFVSYCNTDSHSRVRQDRSSANHGRHIC